MSEQEIVAASKYALRDSQIASIIEEVGKPRGFENYSELYEIRGIHRPCPTNIVAELMNERLLIKGEHNNTVCVLCLNESEAAQAAERINDSLGKYKYKADADGRKLTIEIPWHATLSVLDSIGANMICGTVQKGEEVIMFTVPNGFSRDNLKKIFKEYRKKFKDTFNEECNYPEDINPNPIKKNVLLPKITKFFDWNYLQFILEYKPTELQLRTIDSLYMLLRFGINIYSLNDASLTKLVAKHSGSPESRVRQHLKNGSNNKRLHHLLMQEWVLKNPEVLDTKSVQISKEPQQDDDSNNTQILELGPLESRYPCSQSKIMDFLLTMQDYDYSISDISKNAGVGFKTTLGIIRELEDDDIILKTREVGMAQMYKLNLDSEQVKSTRKLAFEIATKRAKKQAIMEETLDRLESSNHRIPISQDIYDFIKHTVVPAFPNISSVDDAVTEILTIFFVDNIKLKNTFEIKEINDDGVILINNKIRRTGGPMESVKIKYDKDTGNYHCYYHNLKTGDCPHIKWLKTNKTASTTQKKAWKNNFKPPLPGTVSKYYVQTKNQNKKSSMVYVKLNKEILYKTSRPLLKIKISLGCDLGDVMVDCVLKYAT